MDRQEQLAEALREGLLDMEKRKDAAYEERNRVVAALARMALAMGYKAGVRRSPVDGWTPDWDGCVYIDIPTGQCSWHYHDSHANLFAGLPAYTKPWDGHDTPEKYRRLDAYEQPNRQPDPKWPPGYKCPACSGTGLHDDDCQIVKERLRGVQ